MRASWGRVEYIDLMMVNNLAKLRLRKANQEAKAIDLKKIQSIRDEIDGSVVYTCFALVTVDKQQVNIPQMT
jgi:hypothetical protein